MALHSKVKIYVHTIWGTLNHERTLNQDLRLNIFQHLVERADELNITLNKMNIQPEHIHVLLELPSSTSIAEIAKNLKGECTNWINNNDLIQGKFRWQRGYGAYSVSASQIYKVEEYIKIQDGHHKRKTFQEEYKEWTIQYGVWDDDE
jgi:putative transposase